MSAKEHDERDEEDPYGNEPADHPVVYTKHRDLAMLGVILPCPASHAVCP
jgi:hypothetical protein